MKKTLRKILTIMLALILVMQLGLASASAAGKKGPGRDRKPGVTHESKPGHTAPEQKPEEPVAEEPTVTETPSEEPQEEIPAEENEAEVTEEIETEVPEAVDPDPVEEEPAEVTTQEAASEETEVAYDAKPFNGTVAGITVDVDAPEGALPNGTEMVLTPLSADKLAAVEAAVDGTLVDAIDISFQYDGSEIQPNGEVKVTVSSAKIDAVDNATVMHIEDGTNKAVEVDVDPASSDVDGVMFAADSFSVYAVVDNDGLDSDANYVIYTVQSGNYYALTSNAVGATAVQLNGTTVKSDNNNVVWRVTSSGNGYTIRPVNVNDAGEMTVSNYYLRRQSNSGAQANSVQINNTNSNNVWTLTTNDDGYRLSCAVGDDTRYLRRDNNGNVNVNNVNNASTFIFAKVDRIVAPSPTIHLGYLDDDNRFVEFEAGVTYSAADYATDGKLVFKDAFADKVPKDPTEYAYVGARYNDQPNTNDPITEIRENEDDGDIRLNAAGRWIADTKYMNGSNPDVHENQEIESNGHIYVFYEPKGKDGYKPPTVPGTYVDPTSVGPDFAKEVTQNDDGTYTIKLDITGKTAPVQTGQGANVIIVFDTTKSMRYNMEGTNRNTAYNPDNDWTRMYAAKSALKILINKLNPGDGTNGTNLVNISFIDFYADASTVQVVNGQNWTNNKQALLDFVDRRQGNPRLIPHENSSGTNWEVGLQECKTRLADTKNLENLKNNNTFVLFITDGDPNRCEECTFTTYQYNAQAAAHAQDEANYIAENSNLFGVFCGGDTGAERLRILINNASGKQTIEASNQTKLEEALEGIGAIVTQSLGAVNTNYDDGVPVLASVQHEVGGTATDFKYYKNGEPWTDNVPDAEYDPNHGVVWNLPDKLEQGTVYSVEFTVWPTQKAYDTIADLNNGVIDINDLTAAERAGIEGNKTDGYTLKTNTDLSATYVSEVDGQQYSPENIPYSGKKMPLPVEPIKVIKEWNNLVDTRAAEWATDPETGEEYQFIYLIVKKDDEEYPKQILVRSDKGWKSDDFYISNGMISTTRDSDGKVTDFEIRETGHDYTIEEPESYSYYWNLTSDVYHPMVIDGKDKMLILDTKTKGLTGDYFSIGEGADIEEWYKLKNGKYYKVSDADENVLKATNDRRSNLDLKKVVDGFAPEGKKFKYNVTIKLPAGVVDKDVWFYVENDNLDVGENVGKYVYNLDDLGYTNAEAQISNIYNTFVYNEEDDTYTYTYDGVTYTAPAAGEGKYYTGFYSYDLTETTGEDGSKYYTGTFELYLEDGWHAQFTNIPAGTYFEFNEVLEEGYVNKDISANFIESKTGNEIDPTTAEEGETPEITIAKPKVSGTLGLSNGVYYIEYTNASNFFYVYHSSNNTVERIPMADGRIDATNKTFNIVNEVNSGYLYGGYYKEYAGAGMTKDEIVGAEYKDDLNISSAGTYATEKTTGFWAKDEEDGKYPYKGDLTSWTWKRGEGQDQEVVAYEDRGDQMVPANGEVYFLKEVPNVYLQPATYVVYDQNDVIVDSGLENFAIKQLYQVTATDDANYRQVGFDLNTSKISPVEKGLYSAAFFWGSQIDVTQTGKDDPIDELTAGSIVKDHEGLIAARNVTNNGYLVTNAYYMEVPYHVTPDHLRVSSLKRMIIYVRNTRFNTSWKKPGMTKSTIAVKAAYTLFTE